MSEDGSRVMLYGPLGPGSDIQGELPEWLRNLPNIKVLILSGAGLSRLPEWLGDLTTLIRLDLNDNALTELPKRVPQWFCSRVPAPDVGLLGRSHVVVIKDPGVEVPSDLNRLVYITLDSAGAWRYELLKELAAMGIKVDANRIP